jgi:replicative superfamily II helicase
MNRIHDTINAEIAAQKITSLSDAVIYLEYTYLFIRASKNPLAYGISYGDSIHDWIVGTVEGVLKRLEEVGMISYDKMTKRVYSSVLGTVSSEFYLSHFTVEHISQSLERDSEEAAILHTISGVKEFENIRYRESEEKDLDKLKEYCYCEISVIKITYIRKLCLTMPRR